MASALRTLAAAAPAAGDGGRAARGPAASAPSAEERRAERLFRRAARRAHLKRCPGCSAVIEKRLGCDHMRCRCGQMFCYNCGARGHGCPMESKRPRVFDPSEAQRPVNPEPEHDSDSDDGDY